MTKEAHGPLRLELHSVASLEFRRRKVSYLMIMICKESVIIIVLHASIVPCMTQKPSCSGGVCGMMKPKMPFPYMVILIVVEGKIVRQGS